MEISSDMDLSQLKERMSREEVSDTEARTMRRLLVEAGFDGKDTAELPDTDWERLLEQATVR